jgi:ankyrin repeat protein
MSAMMYAAQHGHVAIVQALQREKANPDLGDKVYSFLGTMAEVCIYRIYLSGVVIERRDGAHVCGSRRPHSHRGDVVGVQRRSQSPRQGVFALACSVGIVTVITTTWFVSRIQDGKTAADWAKNEKTKMLLTTYS